MTESTDTEPSLHVDDRLSALRDRLSDAPEILLCLDYDGTLAPIVSDPDEADIPPETRRALRRVHAQPTVDVAVVSGRSLADLRERVGVDGLYYAGNHGLELNVAGERTVDEDVRARRPAVKRAVTRLQAELTDVPGCEVEDKGLTATVHYRRMPDEHVSAVKKAVENGVEETDGLRLSRGKQILELRPDVDGGKDRAVRNLRKRHPEHLPVFVGDDVTDEDAFRELSSDGIGILVGDRDDTAASASIPDSERVQELLDWIVEIRGE